MSYPVEKVYVKAVSDQYDFFLAMASKSRLAIIELLQNKEMSIKDISAALDISSAVVTKHIQLLEDAGIVESSMRPGVHGLLKLCRLKMNEATVIFNTNQEPEQVNSFTEVEVPVCAYSQAQAGVPCGLSFADHIFGYIDDPKYFQATNRHGLSLIWLSSGYLEYPVELMDVRLENVDRLEISFEICSEHPGFNQNALSDLDFYLNGKKLGSWTSPGDFGERKGRYTPSWWNLGSEYGLLKKIIIDKSGVYLDGVRLNETPLSEYVNKEDSRMTFRISSEKNAKHPGGFNLFGKGFGDYDQGLIFRFVYDAPSQ